MEHDQFTRRRMLTGRSLGTEMLTVLFLAAALQGSAAAAGEVYKCKGADGSITFTNIKCPEQSHAQHYGSYQPVQDSPDQ
jgi:hypothetical protein